MAKSQKSLCTCGGTGGPGWWCQARALQKSALPAQSNSKPHRQANSLQTLREFQCNKEHTFSSIIIIIFLNKSSLGECLAHEGATGGTVQAFRCLHCALRSDSGKTWYWHLPKEPHHCIQLHEQERVEGTVKGKKPCHHRTARLEQRCHAGEHILPTQILRR